MSDTEEDSSPPTIGIMAVVATGRFLSRLRRNLRYQPTYRLDPKEPPNMARIYEVVKSVTEARLSNYEYNEESAHLFTLSLSEDVKNKVNLLTFIKNSRYRIVSWVTMGERRNQKAEITSRCVWSAVDNHVTYRMERESFFVVVTVYMVYKE